MSVLIGQVSDETIELDLWLMSCRVLKREMEFAMFDALVEQCQARGIRKIVGVYIPSKKNSMVAGHYAGLGFSPMGGASEGRELWCYDVPPIVLAENALHSPDRGGTLGGCKRGERICAVGGLSVPSVRPECRSGSRDRIDACAGSGLASRGGSCNA